MVLRFQTTTLQGRIRLDEKADKLAYKFLDFLKKWGETSETKAAKKNELIGQCTSNINHVLNLKLQGTGLESVSLYSIFPWLVTLPAIGW